MIFDPVEPLLMRLFELAYLANSSDYQNETKTRAELEELAKELKCHSIGREHDIYLQRYGVAALANGGHVYLHKFLRGDEHQELHSHPWQAHAYSIVGGYWEERRIEDSRASTGYRVVKTIHKPGSVNIIREDTFHRVDLLEHDAWSICVTGPRTTVGCGWYFWNRDTNITTPWDEFIAATGGNPVATPNLVGDSDREKHL